MHYQTKLIFLVLVMFLGTAVFAQNDQRKPADLTKADSDEAAVQGGAIIVTAPTQIVSPGQAFTASISSSSVTGQNIISFQMNLQYNAGVIQYNGCSNAGTMTDSGLLTCNLVGPGPGGAGVVHVNIFRAAPFADTTPGVGGVLVNLNFTVIGSNGQTSPLVFQSFFFNEGSPASAPVSGLISVGGSTAAETSVGGRVRNHAGNPIGGARVSLMDSAGNVSFALTNPFGYFRFEEVSAGETYVVAVRSKRYTFQPRVITVGEEVTGLDFVAEQ